MALSTRFPRTSNTDRTDDTDELFNITSLLWGFAPFHVVRFAVQSSFFDFLANAEVRKFDEVTDHMGWKPRPTRLLLSILEMLDLVRVDEQAVSITTQARRWFAKSSSLYIGNYFDHLSLLESSYRDLQARMVTDSPYAPLEAATIKAFGLDSDITLPDAVGFFDILNATSTPVAEVFFRSVDIPANATVLDVGAGSGIFIKLLIDQGHSGKVEFLDTPLVCSFARRELKDYAERIDWAAVNWHDWQPTHHYDVIFLHHALHEEKLDAARELLLKCVSALSPLGSVYVIGFLTDNKNTNTLARIFSMNIMLEIGGDNTPLAWLRSVGKEVGLREHTICALPGGRTLWAASRV